MIYNSSKYLQKKTENYIQVQNHCTCFIFGDNKTIQKINKILSYKKTIWIKQYGKIRPKIIHETFLKKKKTITETGIKNSYYFYTGFLPEIKKQMPEIIIKQEKLKSVKLKFPHLNNIIFRDYQKRVLRKVKKYQRGIIHHPTGTGKGFDLLGIISMIQGNTLILCHSVDIVNQIYADIIKFKIKNALLLNSNNYNQRFYYNICISSIQIFKSKIIPEDYEYFDGIIVDECHRISNMYTEILSKVNAPIRIGLTATMPKEKERKMLITGLLGDVIDTLTPKQASDINILSKATVEIIEIKNKLLEKNIWKPKKDYFKTYTRNIVNNKTRNNIIVEKALELNKKNKSCMILVKNIQHGKNIQDLFALQGQNVPFLDGSTNSDIRVFTKLKLSKKQQKTIIASTIFLTGVNIPSLDSIIMALGDKSEIQVVQAIGRCLRRTKTKTTAIVIDFLDGGKYLRNHSLNRIKTYKKQGWKINYI